MKIADNLDIEKNLFLLFIKQIIFLLCEMNRTKFSVFHKKIIQKNNFFVNFNIKYKHLTLVIQFHNSKKIIN